MDEPPFENGQEIATNDGILMRRGPAAFMSEIANKTTGTLSLVHYVRPPPVVSDGGSGGGGGAAASAVLCIEWKPNDFLIADADSQENGDWSLVDTIAKRRRTPSESLAFADHITQSQQPPPQPPQQQQRATASPTPTAAAAVPPPTPAPASAVPTASPPRLLRVPITELQHIAVAKKNHILQLVQRSSTATGTATAVHSEYFFQHGNAEGFVRGLQSTHCLRRSQQRPDQYEIVVDTDAAQHHHDKEKLRRTFEELRIEDIKGSGGGGGGGWLSSMVRDPFVSTFGLLARVSDAYAVLPGMHNADGGAAGARPDYDAAARAHRAALMQRRQAAQSQPQQQQQQQSNSGNSGSSDTKPGRTSTSSVGSPPTAMMAEYDILSNASPASQHNRSGGSSGGGPSLREQDEHGDEETADCSAPRLPRRPIVQRGSPMGADEWRAFVADDGRIADVAAVRERIFRGGCENAVRRDVWPFLLGLRRWDETHEQRRRAHAQRTSEYFKMKMQWLSMTATQEKNFLGYQARKCQVEKDVLRTDRTIEFFEGEENKNVGMLQDILMTYVMYNFDLGYVQGMSDLLAPILAVMQDEVDAFWCFVGFMEMVYTNFDLDQGGMKHQLRDLHVLLEFCNRRLFDYFLKHQSDNMYVCFRWLLVWFKREFTYYDIMSLWEVMWTRLPCVNFQLMISVAILDEHEDTIIGRGYEFTEILKFVNELAYRMDYRAILRRAEAILLQVQAADHLTDRVRRIIGVEPLASNNGNGGVGGVGAAASSAAATAASAEAAAAGEEDLDGFDTIAAPVKSLREMEEEQRKIEEACQRSMYNSFY